MTTRTFTTADFEAMAERMQSRCWCATGQLDSCTHCRDAAMLRQAAAASERERVGMAAARKAICQELSQAIDRFNDDDSKGIGQLIDVIAPWLEEAQAPMADVLWMTRDEMQESSEREAALREELAMAARETARLLAVNGESNAVCSCGCELVDHEERGEDGWSCDNESHECVPTSMAVAQMLRSLRDDNARLAERVKWFEASGGVAVHTQVFQEIAARKAAESALAAERQKVQELVEWHIKRVKAGRESKDALGLIESLGLFPTEPTPPQGEN